MVDSIGKFSIAGSDMVGKKRKDFLQKTVQKMEEWRDKARTSLFQLRERYMQKVQGNKDLMKAKKTGGLPNLNPCAPSATLGNKPKSCKYGITHSTVPQKPRYSRIDPAERIYGNKWKARQR